MTNYQLPTQTTLILGTRDQTEYHSQRILQVSLCQQTHNDEESAAGCFCQVCQKIKNQQHYSIVFISPGDNYTLDDIAIIFDRTRFAADSPQYYLLFDVQRLTQATANKLLKLLEEPPENHFFILHADNAQTILPTITSRCTLINLHLQEDNQFIKHHPLLKHFLSKEYDPFTFEQDLKTVHPSDTQSTELAYDLLNYMRKELSQALLSNNQKECLQLEIIICYLLEKLHQPPQSGSSELFWKNLYLSFPRSL